MSSLGRPFSSFFQVAPPSVVLQIPEPGPPSISVQTCRRRWYDAAYMTSGFRGSMTTSVIPVFSSTVRIGFQAFPPSRVS